MILVQIVGELSMHGIFLPLNPHHLLEVFLVLEVQLFGLPSAVLPWSLVMSSVVPASVRYLSASLGTEWRAMEFWCLRMACIWTSSFFVMSVCSPIIVALYSFSRFMSDLPPCWHGRYILSTSALLASIWFIHNCFLAILSRSCISSSFQSMTP